MFYRSCSAVYYLNIEGADFLLKITRNSVASVRRSFLLSGCLGKSALSIVTLPGPYCTGMFLFQI